MGSVTPASGRKDTNSPQAADSEDREVDGKGEQVAPSVSAFSSHIFQLQKPLRGAQEAS